MTMTGTTAASGYAKQPMKYQYTDTTFKVCEKCGAELEKNIWSTIKAVYSCNECGFSKSFSHVSFGFTIKIPNYKSITETHAANKLTFNDNMTIKRRIKNSLTSKLSTVTTAKNIWDKWARENVVEIVRLTALKERFNLGADPKLSYEDNPMNFLPEHFRAQKGVYLNLISITTNKAKKIQLYNKISYAIDYISKKTTATVWIGGTHPNHPAANILASTAHRNNKPFIEFAGYDSFEFYRRDEGFLDKAYIPRKKSNLADPVYITGPPIHECLKHGFKQENLDVYVATLLTSWDEKLPEKNKLKVILNTGNSGIDTSVIRWAIANDRYSIIVNVPTFMYLNEEGYIRSGGRTEVFNRILHPERPKDVFGSTITIGQLQ
jgi:hypothetical protein